MYRLNLFGTFSLSGPTGEGIVLRSAKAKALLAYLAQAAGKPRTREEIMALLWSDRQESQARASLRQVLSGLRRETGEDVLRIDRETVALNMDMVSLTPPNGEEFLLGLQAKGPALEDWLRDARIGFEDDPEQNNAKNAETYGPTHIAVLPFANLSSDPEQQFFADGITEDIITELSRFHNLRVIGRSSSFAYGDQGADPMDAGGSLGVSHVVQGSVRRAGDRLRVSVQLVDVESGAHVWADRYDRRIEDVFDLQDDVVASVVAKLGLSLNEIETARVNKSPTRKMSAYDHLLRARSRWWRGKDKDAYQSARQAVDVDPDFALAHAYFALQNAYQFYSGSVGLTNEAIAMKCKFHAETALDLNNSNPLVHAYASMAFGFSPLAEKERGLKHSSIAIAMNPNDCELLLFHSWQLAFAGRHSEALELLERVSSLNPLGDYMIAECLVDTNFMLAKYSKSLELINSQGDVLPPLLAIGAACYAHLGQTAKARSCLEALEIAKPDGFTIEAFAKAQCASCLRDDDRENWLSGFRKAGVAI